MSVAKVLLADDEKPFVENLIKLLKIRDIDTVPAFNGREALDRLEEDNTIDVVVLDVKMPLMDGMTALWAIKSRHPLVQVILLTGHATVENGISGMKMGAFDYLLKPCDVGQLVARIIEATRHKRRHEKKIMAIRKWGRLVCGVPSEKPSLNYPRNSGHG
ncbi:hypothetical protein DSCA_64630 [Desulfosarcina alkanivorans]|uniref:Response regulatory domain-containing protein n=1 Tax=Desulfosarcina alkanivorans TaxID=571177 RepID=A0A5K7YX45_9BACT|nr:response regulator [Desulfosarcina alkanivorans]BBO72533.1 hypothetical protein DSCA_64630 [Desulfosarcina alkanivorans]